MLYYAFKHTSNVFYVSVNIRINLCNFDISFWTNLIWSGHKNGVQIKFPPVTMSCTLTGQMSNVLLPVRQIHCKSSFLRDRATMSIICPVAASRRSHKTQQGMWYLINPKVLDTSGSCRYGRGLKAFFFSFLFLVAQLFFSLVIGWL